ncbi:MAG: tetratricopeptide repeat protein [Oscillospiraceae bacterium]|jgi:hypothetical protein|nr:tetratricopeptide repeat protein [Oscillospiraceae bacterium]
MNLKINWFDLKALNLHRIALNVRKSVMGKEHPFVGQSYNDIGDVWRNQEKYKKALK